MNPTHTFCTHNIQSLPSLSSLPLSPTTLLLKILPACNGPASLKKSASGAAAWREKRRERASTSRREQCRTMVLLGLGTTWGCTRWLHREDFVFELNNKKAGDKSMLKSVLAAEPSQYWLLGFKDRALEREYLEDLVKVSAYRLSVGSFLALLLYCVFFFQVRRGESQH